MEWGYFGQALLAALFSTILTKPLQNLEKRPIKVADGEIGTDIELPKSSDEIRSVAEAFQHMVVNLRYDCRSKLKRTYEKTAITVDNLSAETGAAATTSGCGSINDQ